MSNQQARSVWNVYVRKGLALIPHVARTEAGFFLDIEPVMVAKVDELQSLASAIGQAMAAGNPRVPTPTRDEYKKPVVLKPAGVRTWKALERAGAVFTIFQGAEEIEITESGRAGNGEWMDAPSLSQRLAANSSAFDIAKRIAERIRGRNDLS